MGNPAQGATTFFIDKQIDTGNLLLQRETEIPFEWDAGHLHDHLKELGADLVLETVQALEAGNVKRPIRRMIAYFLHPAPKIFKEDCKIEWRHSARRVYNFIRGLSPYPTAWTLLEGEPVKIYSSHLGAPTEEEDPGTIRVDSGKLEVACADRWLEILSLQVSGRKRLATPDFLKGYKGKLEAFS